MKIHPADSKFYYDSGGDLKYRLVYDLFSKAVVVDIGASGGDWAGVIEDKYKCRVHCFEIDQRYFGRMINFRHYNCAVSDKTGVIELGEYDGELSTYYPNGKKYSSVRASEIFDMIGEDYIHLMKINVEGAEYEILQDLIDSGKIKQIEDLQVQFHKIERYEEKYEKIRLSLHKTHWIRWRFPYVWESWQNLSRMKYSQIGQDQFVYHFIKEGTFIDIGAGWPDHLNNTLLLEENGWDGISLDIKEFDWNRDSLFIMADALTVKWEDILKDNVYDYLSLDIEGDGLRVRALKNILKTGVEFKIITIEHDAYRGYEKSEREPQREILIAKGYDLVCSNVLSLDNEMEDWWINPKYIKNYEHLRCDRLPYKEILSRL